ncbi:GTPase [Jannaschia sp. CCS1]|uniref:GTPase n=1 Tax=Jannaschia sp. (strain CCS1) TaxID=290400 RepID=UPI000053D3BB|nr:GTPase [Jannaschia sp. CCS1]ABD57063.1 hypothetical protein Jann_4146 [Jannaschia sp. CCS1]
MTDAAATPTAPHSQKPRVLLLGEFSAGKSTLANILLGSAQSPVRVTATQMPPICYVAGVDQPMRVTRDGNEIPVDMVDVPRVPLDGTRFIRVPFDAPLLEQVDLVDMPGSSDPNMSVDIWNDLLPLADIVLWCTPATQAWRQSEAALWDTLKKQVQDRSLLLLTRIDKIGSTSDRDRVMARVTQETRGLFRAVLPVSLVGLEGAPASISSPDLAVLVTALQDVILNPDLPEQTPVQQEPASAQAAVQSAPPRKPKVSPRRVSALDAGAARPRARRQQAGDRLI